MHGRRKKKLIDFDILKARAERAGPATSGPHSHWPLFAHVLVLGNIDELEEVD